MKETNFEYIVAKQKAFFESGATLSLDFRRNALKKLRQALVDQESKITDALKEDLGKSAMEGYMCEVGLTVSEISHMLKHLNSYAKKTRHKTPMTNFHSASYSIPCPRGCVLIMSPWNYPFLLSVEPLVDAIAAGNTVVLKPSAYSKATSKVICEILTGLFDEELVAVVTGGREENAALLTQHFDYIFFTGSQAVGREVLRKAAENLTPVTLELGGKSPCIVDDTAMLEQTASRIAFGKFLNCGQTCVAPDYILCDEKIKDVLVAELKKAIRKQYGEEPLKNENYGKLINEKHFTRISALINKEKCVLGGKTDADTLRIEPTILDGVTWEDAVMQEEIFGPVLPILTYHKLEEAVAIVESHQHPLALYLFSKNRKNMDYVTKHARYGGGCINDVVVHIATSDMAFGGVGESGMGAYHGKTGFETFSHRKSILDKKTWLDLPMRNQPYKKSNESLLRMFLQ